MTTCPICKKHIRIRRDRRMYVHRNKGSQCPGSGCRPGQRAAVLKEAHALDNKADRYQSVNERMKIWFHGTSEEAAQNIMKAGFRPGTYFAKHLEDAVWYGGGHVFQVAFPADWASEAGWQMTVHEVVPPSSIVGLWRFSPEQLYENEPLRTAVFESQAQDEEEEES